MGPGRYYLNRSGRPSPYGRVLDDPYAPVSRAGTPDVTCEGEQNRVMIDGRIEDEKYQINLSIRLFPPDAVKYTVCPTFNSIKSRILKVGARHSTKPAGSALDPSSSLLLG